MIDIFFQQIEDICRFHYWAVQQCIKNIEANIFDIVIQKMTLKYFIWGLIIGNGNRILNKGGLAKLSRIALYGGHDR